MKGLFVEIFTVVLAFVFIFNYAPPVRAQDTSDYEFTLEEITVTAQKREENQQKVPIAMEIISGEQIKELGQNDISKILQNSSSVIINKATDGFRVSIRGISNDLAPANEDVNVQTPTVAVNTDGVYSNRVNRGTDLFDVERVEVLYGPQSTLYASASPGGIVNVVTANPKTDKYEVSGSLEFGNYNLQRTEAMLNAPLSDKMAWRAAFSSSVRDGYVTDNGDDQDTRSGRLRALYSPTDKFTFVLTGEITKTGGHGFVSVDQFDDQDDVDNPWTAASSSDDYQGSTTGALKDDTQKKIYARIDMDFEKAGTLSIVPFYTKNSRDENYTTYGGMYSDDQVNYTERTNEGYEKGVELRMTSSSDFFFKWIAGFTWYKSSETGAGGTTETFEDNTYITIERLSNLQTTYALFGNITYPITDRFRATGGVRKNWDENSTHNYQWHSSDDTEMLRTPTVKYSKPDYKLGMEYDMSEQSMLYMDWASSYRINGGDMVDGNDNPFPPEELNAYSLGAKNRFFGNRLQVNASAYYYDYKNYLVYEQMMSIYDENGNGVRDADETEMEEDNAGQTVGDARVYGVDLQTSTILTDHGKLDLSVSYLRKYFTDLYFDYEPITNSMGMPDQDFSDVDMTNSPHWTFNATYSHSFPLPNGGILTGRIDSRYQSSYLCSWHQKTLQFNDDMTAVEVEDLGDTVVQEAYHISNLSAIYTHPDGKWSITGYVKNLENYAVKLSVMRSDMVIGSPRTYGAILSLKY